MAAILTVYAFTDDGRLVCREYPALAPVALSRIGTRHAALLSGVLISADEAADAYAALVRLALEIATRRAAVTDPAGRAAIQCVAETDALVAYSEQAAAAAGGAA